MSVAFNKLVVAAVLVLIVAAGRYRASLTSANDNSVGTLPLTTALSPSLFDYNFNNF